MQKSRSPARDSDSFFALIIESGETRQVVRLMHLLIELQRSVAGPERIVDRSADVLKSRLLKFCTARTDVTRSPGAILPAFKNPLAGVLAMFTS